jgi:integrase/recombinase XerD
MLPVNRALCSRRTYEWLSGSTFEARADSCAQILRDRGYEPSTIRQCLSGIAHFAYWCLSQGIDVSEAEERHGQQFVRRHLPSCQCATRCLRLPYAARAAVMHFIQGASYGGRPPLRVSTVPASVRDELWEFERYLKDVRGLADLTREAYLHHTEAFLSDCFPSGPVSIRTLHPKDVAHFVKRYTAGWKPVSIKSVNNALRCYFAFKTMGGEQTVSLCNALPKVALWRLAQLPKMISAPDIRRLLQSYDRTSPIGKRDYAIARCLIDLGLRRAEVSRLKLEDIDWQEGVMRLSAKGRRVDVLPLPSGTGSAIADYLRHGRPQTAYREIFVRHNAPCNVPASVDLIRSTVRQAAARCGLQDHIRGTHILRHTLAGRLVKSGTPLKEIADLLRHRDINTTTIYAKVDFPALTKVARAWPGSVA